MTRVILAGCCVLLGCAHPRGPEIAPVSAPLTVLAEPLADPIAFVPGELVDAYSTPSSERLSQLAAELDAVTRRGEPITPELLAFARHAHGIVAPAAPLGVEGPRSVKRGHGYDYTLTPDPLLRELHVHARHADGHDEEVALRAGPAGAVHAFGGCGMVPEEMWLVVEAQPVGEIAEWPVYCGLTPPSTYWIEPHQNLDAPDPAARLVSIINRQRRRIGRTPLASEPRAVRAALGFTARMRAAHSIEHVIEGSTPVDRVAAEGLVAQRTAEATLHTEDLRHAAEQLMNAPKYSAQLEAPDLNRIGVAVASDDAGGLYVDLLYLDAVPPVDTHRMTRELAVALRDHRNAASWMRVDKELSELAHTFATLRARGWSDETIRRAYESDVNYRLGSLGLTWNTEVVTDTARISLDELTGGAPFDLLAIGVAQASDRGALAGSVFIVTFTGCLGGEMRSFGDPWPDCHRIVGKQ